MKINNILNKKYDEITEVEKMILTLKYVIKKYNNIKIENEEKAQLGAFISATHKYLLDNNINILED